MNKTSWRIVAGIMAGIVAILGGVAIAIVVLPPGSPRESAPAGGPAAPYTLESPSPSQVALASSSAAVTAPSSAPSKVPPSQAPPSSAAASPTAAVGPSQAAPTSTAASQSVPGEPTATLTFVNLKLDATTDQRGETRLITFSTNGPGTISVRLITRSPQGEARMCLKAAGQQLCKLVSNGTVTANAISGHTDWSVTLRGAQVFTPVTDIVLTFPAASPSVTISHSRFAGKTHEDYNGIQARVDSRADGAIHLVASWTDHDFTYGVDLKNERNGAGDTSLTNQGPARTTDNSFRAVAGATFKLGLRNEDSGSFGRTQLAATISWP